MNRAERRALRQRAKDADGCDLLVIRPSRPAVALALAKVALDHNDPALLDRLPLEVETAGATYTFVGYLLRSGEIADATGNVIEPNPQPGDSFVTRVENS